ncbi:MAG TPA: phage major capsid protein, partial [Steroidobacteraceae bacterium]
DPTNPHEQYPAFVKACLRGIASGLDISYASLANDLESVNFSSIRAGTLEERDHWMTLQGWFIDTFLSRLYDDWLASALGAGAIVTQSGAALPLGQMAKFRAHVWQGRRWSWVDPLKDIQAAALSIQNHIASPQMIAAQSGVDLEDVIADIASYHALLDRVGLQPAPASTAAAQPSDRVVDAADRFRTPQAGARALACGWPPSTSEDPTMLGHPALRRMDKPAAGARGMRECQVTREAVNADARTIDVAFASETPVERWYGNEILDVTASGMRTNRLKNGAALLWNHDTDRQIGVVEAVHVDADRVARATVRFGRGAAADEVFQDVKDGIRRHISVGYVIHEAKLDSSRDGVDTYRVTDWEPYEISLVSVPADPSVGVGRAASIDPEVTEELDMVDTVKQAAAGGAPSPAADTRAAPAPAPAPEPLPAAARGPGIEDAREAERHRVTEILAIGRQWADRGVDKLADKAVADGTSLDAFRAVAMQAIATKPVDTAPIGMTRSETHQYNILRALAFLANPRDRRAREAAAFEIECSEAAADKRGKAAQGLLVPYEVLTRDLTVGTATAGGHTVATNLLAGSFIDMLRNALLLPGMGAQVLNGLVGNVAIPRATGGATAYWVAESGAPTESQASFDQVTLSPKTVGAYSDMSRKLLLQSSIDMQGFVSRDLATALGLAIQQVAINGGGSNEPTGVLATSNIGSVAGGTNGAKPTWGNIVDLETAVATTNALMGTLSYLTNAKVRGYLKSVQRFTSNPSGNAIWADGNTPLNGYPAAVTNAVPSNLDKGSAEGVCSAILFGNWADLIIGMWGGLDLTVDPYTGATSGTVRVVALQDVDVAVR